MSIIYNAEYIMLNGIEGILLNPTMLNVDEWKRCICLSNEEDSHKQNVPGIYSVMTAE